MKTKLTETKFKSAIGVPGRLFSRIVCLGAVILICSSASAQNGPPVVTTNPATFIASFSATLNESLNPHGLPTTFHFQYGTTTNYGLMTAPQTQTGNTVRNVTANISSLTASTTYHFRIVASNADGTRYGSDETFTTLTTTGPPIVTTGSAHGGWPPYTEVLNGTVDPNGLTTTVYFQYGRTTSYGSTTASQTKTGNTYQSVSSTISLFESPGLYHFRIVASNASGTSYGSDQTFCMPCIGPEPCHGSPCNATPTPTPTPCTGRCAPTPRPRPTPPPIP